jgi:uncharacterized membrane protein
MARRADPAHDHGAHRRCVRGRRALALEGAREWIGDVEWDSRIVANEPGKRIAWRSLDGAGMPNEGELLFGPGRPGWGTEVQFTWRFDPPGGALGDLVARLTHAAHPAHAMAALILRRFKSLAETGEVPTLAHNPTTREDPDPFGAFE